MNEEDAASLHKHVINQKIIFYFKTVSPLFLPILQKLIAPIACHSGI